MNDNIYIYKDREIIDVKNENYRNWNDEVKNESNNIWN